MEQNRKQKLRNRSRWTEETKQVRIPVSWEPELLSQSFGDLADLIQDWESQIARSINRKRTAYDGPPPAFKNLQTFIEQIKKLDFPENLLK